MSCCVVSQVLGVSQVRNTFLRHSLKFYLDGFIKCCLSVQELKQWGICFQCAVSGFLWLALLQWAGVAEGSRALVGICFGQPSLIKKQKPVCSWWGSLDMDQLIKALNQIMTSIQTFMPCSLYTWLFSWRNLGKNIQWPGISSKGVTKICLRICLADTSDKFEVKMVHCKFKCGPWRMGKIWL